MGGIELGWRLLQSTRVFLHLIFAKSCPDLYYSWATNQTVQALPLHPGKSRQFINSISSAFINNCFIYRNIVQDWTSRKVQDLVPNALKCSTFVRKTKITVCSICKAGGERGGGSLMRIIRYLGQARLWYKWGRRRREIVPSVAARISCSLIYLLSCPDSWLLPAKSAERWHYWVLALWYFDFSYQAHNTTDW